MNRFSYFKEYVLQIKECEEFFTFYVCIDHHYLGQNFSKEKWKDLSDFQINKGLDRIYFSLYKQYEERLKQIPINLKEYNYCKRHHPIALSRVFNIPLIYRYNLHLKVSSLHEGWAKLENPSWEEMNREATVMLFRFHMV